MNYIILEFSWLNLFFIGLFVLISYLVITDDRFNFNRKIAFLLLLVILALISIYIDKVRFDIINDLFWFSLILNGSFIIHTLILDRMFHYCWKNHYQYIGFLISRISFTLSLLGLNYIINNILRAKLIFPFYEIALNIYLHENKEKSKFWISYAIFYINHINSNLLLNFLCEYITKIICFCCDIIETITIYFSIIFANYSLLLLGKQDNKLNIEIMKNYILQFGLLLIISIIIGIPRLYIIWFLYGLIEFYKMFNFEYYYTNPNHYEKTLWINLKFIDKIKYIYENWNKLYYLYSYRNYQYFIFQNIFERPYHTFFMFNLFDYLFHHSFSIKIKNRLDDTYKFYTWEEIAMININYSDLYYKEFADHYEDTPYPIRPENERLEESLLWLDLINRKNDEKLLKKLLSQDIRYDNLDNWHQKYNK